MNGTAPTTLELRDIHLPEPISWWPPAPGWWLLLAAVAIIVAAFFFYRYYQKKQALKKTAIAEFEQICAQFKNKDDTLWLVQSLSVLLRRSCISFYPRSEVASLTGEHWLGFLDRTMDSKNPGHSFHSEYGQLIATAPYLADNAELNIDAEKLIALCASWLHAQPSKNYPTVGKQS